jgi:signal recognition particle subunit SRP19
VALDEDKAWVLWPEYFDISRSRAEGRKVGKDIAVASPTLDMLVIAVKHLGLQYKAEPEKAYPGAWHQKRGRVLVERTLPKTLLLKKVGQHLKKMPPVHHPHQHQQHHRS